MQGFLGAKMTKNRYNYVTLKHDNKDHWYECECGAFETKETHKGGTATCIELAVCSVCNCEYGELEEHNYNTLKNNETEHWRECECRKKDGVEAHNYQTFKNDEEGHWQECFCGVRNKVENHDYEIINYDKTKHWYECSCGYSGEANHDYAILKNNETDEWYEPDDDDYELIPYYYSAQDAFIRISEDFGITYI